MHWEMRVRESEWRGGRREGDGEEVQGEIERER